MRTWIFVVICAGLSLGFAAGRWSAPRPPVYENHELGFRISAPVAADGAMPPNQPLVAMYAAPSDGFAPNLNIVRQPAGSIDAFKSVSLAQFKQMQLVVDKEESLKVQGRDAWRCEYHGKLSGNEMHVMALAVSGKDGVILATCTALEKQFGGVRDAFRASLDSFTWLNANEQK